MKKAFLFVISCLFIILMFAGCRQKKFYDQEVVWYSEKPEITFSHKAYGFHQYMVIDGEKKDIYCSYSRDGTEITIYDKDAYPYEDRIIWECSVKWNKRKNIIKVIVDEDYVSEYKGTEFTMYSRPIMDSETWPEDERVICDYKNSVVLLDKLKIPTSIVKVFKDESMCLYNDKMVSLSEISDDYWAEFTEMDIDKDGKNELLYKLYSSKSVECGDTLLIFKENDAGDVILTKLLDNQIIHVYEDGIVSGISNYENEDLSDKYRTTYYRINVNDDKFSLEAIAHMDEINENIHMYVNINLT